MFPFVGFKSSTDDAKSQPPQDRPRKRSQSAQKVQKPVLRFGSPSEIYTAILGEVDAFFCKVTKARHESEQINEAKRQCHELLSQIQSKVKQKIFELEGNAEWNEFTIAFYGETNAGKSTIIEALRIHLAEASKKAEQDAFIYAVAKAGLSKAAFDDAQQAVSAASQRLSAFEADFAACTSHAKAELEQLQVVLHSQQQLAASVKASAPFWRKLVFLFKEPQEAREAKLISERLQTRKADVAREFEALKQQHQSLKVAKTSAEERLAGMTRKLESLAQLADGRIIGDGQSDFTRETRAYRFDTGYGRFVLLDVPGIEGKEQAVIDEVLKAVQKAHAVFYVTSKAAPPQRGENDQVGTLEKIKAHLNDQTEVWTIFNKRITNPMQLNGAIISDDEQVSLDTLSAVMRKQLGKNYAGTLTVAARPAFLAVAECLVPFSSEVKNKEKFVRSMGVAELIERSGLGTFSLKLGEEIIAGFPAKIRKANFNKATTVLNDAIQGIKSVRDEQVGPLIASLKKTEAAASQQLQGALDELNADFIAEADSQIEIFKSTVRQKIYRRIEQDISNDDFKDSLENILEAELPELNTRITRSAEVVFEKFKQSARRALEDYKRQAAELQSIHGSFEGGSLNSRFELNINIDHGVNITGLLGSLISGALLWWTGAGLLAAAVSAVGIVVSIYKSVRSFFSSKYKKEQQREAADKNIRSVAREIESSASTAAREAIDKIREHLQETGKSLKEPIHAITFMSEALENSVQSLTTLSKAVKAQAAD